MPAKFAQPGPRELSFQWLTSPDSSPGLVLLGAISSYSGPRDWRASLLISPTFLHVCCTPSAPQAESPAGCPEPCPTSALCPSSAPSVPLPLLPGWTCPSLASWALTMPRTVPGAASPHAPAPLPCHSSPLPCSPVPCHECPSPCQPSTPLASNPRQKVLQVSIRNTTCTWIAPSAPQVTKMPCPGLAGCSAGPQNSPESPFVVYLPLPPLRTNLSTWGASRQA